MTPLWAPPDMVMFAPVGKVFALPRKVGKWLGGNRRASAMVELLTSTSFLVKFNTQTSFLENANRCSSGVQLLIDIDIYL